MLHSQSPLQHPLPQQARIRAGPKPKRPKQPCHSAHDDTTSLRSRHSRPRRQANHPRAESRLSGVAAGLQLQEANALRETFAKLAHIAASLLSIARLHHPPCLIMSHMDLFYPQSRSQAKHVLRHLQVEGRKPDSSQNPPRRDQIPQREGILLHLLKISEYTAANRPPTIYNPIRHGLQSVSDQSHPLHVNPRPPVGPHVVKALSPVKLGCGVHTMFGSADKGPGEIQVPEGSVHENRLRDAVGQGGQQSTPAENLGVVPHVQLRPPCAIQRRVNQHGI
mmetsp:Transcript_24178/g.55162  ORF Transcript_24178/g.55162 Transcript_24178/m.55162 type:complete len:279 (-) Transcript_24178:792-1628(-)